MWPLVVMVGCSWVVTKADSTVEHLVEDQQAFLAMVDLNLTTLLSRQWTCCGHCQGLVIRLSCCVSCGKLAPRQPSRHHSQHAVEGQGCKPCSDRQKGYCLSNDLLMDHCICDHRHIERLPYVEHTCYVPDRLHPTFATDCLEYVRVLECCCHAILLPLMKKKAQNRANANVHLNWPMFLLILTTLRL